MNRKTDNKSLNKTGLNVLDRVVELIKKIIGVINKTCKGTVA